MAESALIVTMTSKEFADMLDAQAFRLAINVKPPSVPQRRVGPRGLLSGAIRTAFVVDAKGGFELLAVSPPRVHFSADEEPAGAPPSASVVAREPQPRPRRSAARGPRPPAPYYWSIPACWVASVVAAFVVCFATIAVLVYLLVHAKN